MSSDILYIGKLVYTRDGENFEHLHNDKKVGITKNLNTRATGLTGTNSPFVWVPIRAWKNVSGSAQQMEGILHNLMRARRITGLTKGKKSEWFEDEENVLVRDVSALLDNHPDFERVVELDSSEESVEDLGSVVRKTDEKISSMVNSLKGIMSDKVDETVYASGAGGNAYSVFYTQIRGRKTEVVSLAPKDGTISFKFAIKSLMSDVDNQEFCKDLIKDFVEEFPKYSLEKSGSNLKITIRTLEEFSILMDEVMTFIRKQ